MSRGEARAFVSVWRRSRNRWTPTRDPRSPNLEPFAAEIGRGDVIDGGYAVGVRREDDGKTVAEVARVDEQAGGGELLRLDVARGDMDAPIVRSRGKGFVAAMLEPNASGIALRLASFDGGEPRWGAEIDQGRDESLAFDFGFSGDAGVVVWDDITEDGKRGRVMRAVVKAADVSLVEKEAEVSSKGMDADQPRVVPRAGGFWLAFVARAPAKGDDTNKADDGRYAAERIEPSWLQLVPLDRSGKPEGASQAITPKSGHVLGFDLMTGKDGAAIVAWRDDDTPSGAQGGRVSIVLVTASGGGGQEQLVADRNVGAGVPTLVPGWIALPDDEGATLLAPIADDGQVLAEPRVEQAMGLGQLVASRKDVLLVAKPAGRAVDLVTLACSRSVK